MYSHLFPLIHLFCPAILQRWNVSGTKITLRSYKLENNTFKKDLYFSGRNIKTVVYGEKIKQNKSNCIGGFITYKFYPLNQPVNSV